MDSNVKVGEDDDGRKLRMKYSMFAEYCRYQEDDSGLYLFESGIDRDPRIAKLREDYKVNILYFKLRSRN